MTTCHHASFPTITHTSSSRPSSDKGRFQPFLCIDSTTSRQKWCYRIHGCVMSWNLFVSRRCNAQGLLVVWINGGPPRVVNVIGRKFLDWEKYNKDPQKDKGNFHQPGLNK